MQVGLWRLLRDIWLDKGLDTTSRIVCFRRHNFSAILQEAFEDLIHHPVEERPKIIIAIDAVLDRMLAPESCIKIRPQVEQATLVFGLCLTVVNELPQVHCILRNNITQKISRIYRTILHEDRQTKKVQIFQYVT